MILVMHEANGQHTMKDIIDLCFAAVSYASKSTIHTMLQTTPGALVSNWDILLQIQCNMHDWIAIRHRKPHISEQNLQHKNVYHLSHDNRVDDEVFGDSKYQENQ